MKGRLSICGQLMRWAAVCAAVLGSLGVCADGQAPVQPSQVAAAVPEIAPGVGTPIAIVPVDAAASVTGALEISRGKAMIATAGTITSGAKATEVTLPRRGTLRVCASTSVRLATDKSVPDGETPGLMIALDQGALETSFATGRNADVVLTPDFRVLIGGPGPSDLKIRLGQHGDTCVDNPGQNAPYVLVTSVFDGSVYRVQPNQRVMFQHGSLQEVVDNEKEPCGCPAPARPGSNDFPLAESAGLSPKAPPVIEPQPEHGTGAAPTVNQALVYEAKPVPDAAAETSAKPAAAVPAEAAQAAATVAKPAAGKKPGVFRRIGRFLKKIFGAES